MKKNVISTITKSLPIEFSSLVNYSLLVTLCYINDDSGVMVPAVAE